MAYDLAGRFGFVARAVAGSKHPSCGLQELTILRSEAEELCRSDLRVWHSLPRQKPSFWSPAELQPGVDAG